MTLLWKLATGKRRAKGALPLSRDAQTPPDKMLAQDTTVLEALPEGDASPSFDAPRTVHIGDASIRYGRDDARTASERQALYVTRPWLEFHAPKWTRKAALHPEEGRFLYWCGRALFRGIGVVVDIESPVADATSYVAAGLLENDAVQENRKRIISINPFIVTKDVLSSVDSKDFPLGSDYLLSSRSHWGAAAKYIDAQRDIAAYGRSALPIEILYCGSAPKWSDFEKLVQTFFCKVIPGTGIIILRDYVYSQSYWMHLFMGYYAEYFDPIVDHIPRTTSAWRLTKPLPLQAFVTEINNVLTITQMLGLMDLSIERYDQPYSTLIAIGKGHLIADAIGYPEAREYGNQLHQSVLDDKRAIPHVERFLAWINRESRHNRTSKRVFHD